MWEFLTFWRLAASFGIIGVIGIIGSNLNYAGHETKLEHAHSKPNPCINVDCNNMNDSDLITETFPTFESFDIKCKLNLTDKNCKVLNLTVKIPDSVIEKIVTINDKEMSQNLNLVEKLSIVEQSVEFLPTNLAEKLPNLAEITIKRSKLLEIAQENFANLKSLTSLKIVGNNLRTISEHSFDDNVKLEKLILSSNRIAIIANNTFSSLSHLKILDLSHNYLTSVDNVNFENLVSMQTLKLNNNKLRDIKSGLFDTCSELLYLDISSNYIKILASDLVPLNNKIIEFRADNNNVKIIDNQLLNRLNQTHLINLTKANVDEKVQEKIEKETEKENSEITPNDPNIEDKLRSEATFTLTIKNFSNLSETILSEAHFVRGLSWKIMAMPRLVIDKKTLGFFLQCNAECNFDWNCSATADLRILSFNKDIMPVSRKIENIFYNKQNDWGYSTFKSFSDILNPDNGYIQNDTVVLEVHVQAEAPHYKDNKVC